MKNKKTLIVVFVLIAVIGFFAGLYAGFSEKPEVGAKTVYIEVVDAAESVKEYTVQTDAEYLRQVMDEAEGLTYGGADSEYGIMIDSINGVRADYTLDGAYWSFYVNGEYCNYGIDTQPVADGDVFKIEYTLAE
ncbi:MAG: DUF4430 domain-containing protein [Ruminococcaceae bacterium]|nr:DUF4430 domain-containing protein [Oscillospiraceae bacterium]